MHGLLEGVAHFEQVGLMIRASSRTSIVKTLFFGGVNTDQFVLHWLTDAHSSATVVCWSRICGGMTSPDFCREATLWNVKFCFGFVTGTSQIIEALPSWAGIRARLVDLC
jgi:hypothetical protein